MYKNFSLTDKEKKEILEQHGSRGYKQPKEQISHKKNMMLGEMLEQFSNNNDVKPQYGRIYFNNGGDISVQASSYHYSMPRDDQGPYTHIELGYPSQGTKIPDSLLGYAESDSIYKTVYPYVPSSVVKELIDANGGIKSGELPPMEDEMEDEYNDYEEIQERKYSYKKPLNEQPFGDDSKFFISHVGIPVDIIMVSVELDGFDDGDVTFKIKVGRNGNFTIVDFTNDTKGEIDDEEVKEYMENMIANGELNVSDYISFDPNTGVYRNLQW